MKVFRDPKEFQKGLKPVVTIGTFDGVHNGHKKILKRVVESAKSLGGESVLISFHPHPRLVLFPEDNPLRLLNTIEEKIEILDELGIDKVLLIPFSKAFSRLSSSDFITKILLETVGMHRIIIGYDHHFGKNREGSLKDLLKGASLHEYGVEEIHAFQIDEANVSSTKIRKALANGDISVANKYLGYSYSLEGAVVKGNQLGRKIGFPTANIVLADKWKLIPSNGVYRVRIKLDEREFFGMLNIGNKPTIGSFPVGIEVHIFDFDEDIYGKNVRLFLDGWIREEKKFDSVSDLIIQLKEDEKSARVEMS